MSFEETLKALLVPALREVVREEVRAAVGAQKPAANGDYLSVADAALVADVHVDTIRDWINLGYLTRKRAGKRNLRVLRSELKRLLDEGPPKRGGASPEETAAAILNRHRP